MDTITIESKKEYRFKDNPKEKLFVKNLFLGFPQFMKHIEDVTGLKNPTEREVQVFIHTVQWMGSPVGQSLIQEVEEEFQKMEKNEKH